MNNSTSKKYLDIASLVHAVERVVAKLKEHMKSDVILYEPTRMKYLKIAEMLEFCTRTAYELARCPRENEFPEYDDRFPEVFNETDEEFTSTSTSETLNVTKCVTTIPGVEGYISIEKVLPAGAIVVPNSQFFGVQVLGVEIPQEDKFELAEELEDNYSSEASKAEESSGYTAKRIVGTFYKIADRLDSDISLPFMPQVRSCASYLSEWIVNRFCTRSTLFHYNSDNIRNWADKFLVSFGYYWNIGKIDKFGVEFEKWLQDVKLDRSAYPLPKFISIQDLEPGIDLLTPESVYLERVLKIVMYGDNFYPQQLHTIEEEVITKHPEYSEMTAEEIYKLCNPVT